MSVLAAGPGRSALVPKDFQFLLPRSNAFEVCLCSETDFSVDCVPEENWRGNGNQLSNLSFSQSRKLIIFVLDISKSPIRDIVRKKTKSTMDDALASAGLQPPSSSHVQAKTKPVRKPFASRDLNQVESRKPSTQKALIVRKPKFENNNVASRVWIKGSNHENVPLIKTKTLEELIDDHRLQQNQLALLQQELVEYKAETNKTMEIHLFDRFEGIKKHEVMSQFACKWFGILMVAHAFFYYAYFIVRKSSQTFVDDDEVGPDSARIIAFEGLLQVSLYSVAYLFIVLFDIFWHVVIPDRVRCERTTANTHVIVAAHRAHESLEVMLPTVLRTFAPECVWVADNGFSDKNTEELCNRMGVNYEYNEAGNKANALVVVARKIKRRHGDAIKNSTSHVFCQFYCM
jgi:hypothetical protein